MPMTGRSCFHRRPKDQKSLLPPMSCYGVRLKKWSPNVRLGIGLCNHLFDSTSKDGKSHAVVGKKGPVGNCQLALLLFQGTVAFQMSTNLKSPCYEL